VRVKSALLHGLMSQWSERVYVYTQQGEKERDKEKKDNDK